jgi:hypothetical protein
MRAEKIAIIGHNFCIVLYHSVTAAATSYFHRK